MGEVVRWGAQGELVEGGEKSLPSPGEHWRDADGNWHLVAECRVVENDDIHSVALRAAPTAESPDAHGGACVLLIDEFMAAFTPAESGELWQRFESEAKALLADQQSAAARLIECDEALALPAPDAADGTPGRSLAVRVRAARGDLEAASERTQELIQAQARHRGDQAKALMSTPKRRVGQIERALARLSAYTGEGLRIERLLDGPPAKAPGPIHIYQSLRAMDEEYLVHLAEGGADVHDWSGFGRALMADPDTLSRIIPAEVGLCAMRFRRHDKHYPTGDGDAVAQLTALLNAAADNEANAKRFLLYRDGGSVWAIFHPQIEKGVERLFPTQADAEAARRSRRDRDIDRNSVSGARTTDPSSIHYPEAVARRDRFEHVHRALILLLQGIQEREGLFRAVGGVPWAQAAGDPDRVAWVRDDENLIADGGKADLWAFMAKASGGAVAHGSRVLCDWRALREDGDGRDRSAGWRPVEPFGVATVARRNGRMAVPCEVVRAGRTRREFVPVGGPAVMRSGRRDGFVCLSVADLGDVERHMASRESRRHYLRYYGLFRALRSVLRAMRATQGPARLAVLHRLREVGVDDAARHWETAVRIWTRGAIDRPFPQPGDAGFDASVAKLAGIAERLAAPDAQALLANAPDGALALGVTARGWSAVVAAEPPVAGLEAPLAVRERLGEGGGTRQRRAGRDRAAPQAAPWLAENDIELVWQARDAAPCDPLNAGPDDLLGHKGWADCARLLSDLSAAPLVLGREAEPLAIARWALEWEWMNTRRNLRVPAFAVLPLAARHGTEGSGAGWLAVAALAVPVVGWVRQGLGDLMGGRTAIGAEFSKRFSGRLRDGRRPDVVGLSATGCANLARHMDGVARAAREAPPMGARIAHGRTGDPLRDTPGACASPEAMLDAVANDCLWIGSGMGRPVEWTGPAQRAGWDLIEKETGMALADWVKGGHGAA